MNNMVDDTNSSRTVSIQIPESAEPGDILSFVVNGNDLELEIPIGSKVGDVLEIQLASEQQDQEEDPGEEIVFDLPNKKELRLLQHKRDVKGKEENSTVDGTYGLIWPAGRILVESGLLLKLPKAKNILELGSGSGLVGLAYAASIPAEEDESNSFPAVRRLLLTDSATSLLQTNINRNQHIVSSNNASLKIDTQVLEWSSMNQIKDRFSIILGSDLLYNPSCIPDLVSTIQQCLDDQSSSTIVMSVRWRKPEMERSFFQQAEEKMGVSWNCVYPTSSCFLSWQEFGNPDSESSNRYFSQTTIAVGGTQLKALCDITERDVENSMSSDEYNAWERAFVQIYVGKTMAEDK